jgi:hypothetical protein
MALLWTRELKTVSARSGRQALTATPNARALDRLQDLRVASLSTLFTDREFAMIGCVKKPRATQKEGDPCCRCLNVYRSPWEHSCCCVRPQLLSSNKNSNLSNRRHHNSSSRSSKANASALSYQTAATSEAWVRSKSIDAPARAGCWSELLSAMASLRSGGFPYPLRQAKPPLVCLSS